MAKLEVADAISRAQAYPHAVLAYVGPDGYPVNIAVDFTGSATGAWSTSARSTRNSAPTDGQEVELTFSHIRPQPGVGYDERRYVNLWGPATPTGAGLRVSVRRASGWDEAETPFFEYAERGVPAGRDYLDELGARPRLSGLWTVFLATRLPFLTATLIPVGLGGVVAAHDNAFHALWFVLALVAAIAVHLGLNMANDLFDDANGADAANMNPTPFSGGSRVLQYGLVTRRAMVTGCAALYAVAIGLGLLLAAERGWGLLGIGAGGHRAQPGVLGAAVAARAPWPRRARHRARIRPGHGGGNLLRVHGPVELATGARFAAGGPAHRPGAVRQPDPGSDR